MDPMSFLLIIFVMIIAVQQGLGWIAVGLAGLLLFSAGKSKIMIFAAIMGVAALILIKYGGSGYPAWIILGVLVVILLLLGRKEQKEEEQAVQYQQMMAAYGMGGAR